MLRFPPRSYGCHHMQPRPFLVRHVVRKTLVRKQLSKMTPVSGIIIPLSGKIINMTLNPTLLLVLIISN